MSPTLITDSRKQKHVRGRNISICLNMYFKDHGFSITTFPRQRKSFRHRSFSSSILYGVFQLVRTKSNHKSKNITSFISPPFFVYRFILVITFFRTMLCVSLFKSNLFVNVINIFYVYNTFDHVPLKTNNYSRNHNSTILGAT